MSRLPHVPLDAEERALAAALPRPPGRSEPDAALDARILAAAHAAAQTPPMTRARMSRWTLPLGLAASLCLAVGLAWRIQLEAPAQQAAQRSHPAPPAVATAPASAEQGSDAASQAKAAPPAAATTPPPAAAKPAAGPRPTVPSPRAVMPAASSEPRQTSDMQPATAVAPPPPAPVAAPAPLPPAPPPAEPAMAAPQAAPAMAQDAAPAPAPAAPRPLAAMPAQTAKARSGAAAARASVVMEADAPLEDVPPATANAPGVRDAWLQRISELQRQGRLDDARASLAEFRRRYPDAPLPPDLRALDPSAPAPAGD